MAKVTGQDPAEDENIVLSENEGVDEEDLKAPGERLSAKDDEAEEATDEEEDELDEKSPIAPEKPEPEEPESELEDEEEEPALHPSRKAFEDDEPIEELPRPSYQTTNVEPADEFQPASPRPEHTLNDLAGEEAEASVPSGVDPNSRPKSFRMAYEEDDSDQYSSNIPHLGGAQIPSSGVYSNREPKKKGGGFKLILLLIVAILVLGGAVYLLKGKALLHSTTPSPTEAPISTTETPTPAPTPSFDRSKFKIRVLNGSGKSGLAASVSGKLKDLGYQQDKTGNATNSAFQRTVVRVKATATGLGDNLVKDLAPDYDATASGTLSESDAADGEVIIGSK